MLPMNYTEVDDEHYTAGVKKCTPLGISEGTLYEIRNELSSCKHG